MTVRRPGGFLTNGLAIALVLAAVVGGCFAESYGTPGMQIWNQTSEAIQVVYRRPMGGVDVDDDVVRVGPNQRLTVIGLHQTEGRCLRGTLIALRGHKVVATVAQPCEGATWVVADEQEGSPPP